MTQEEYVNTQANVCIVAELIIGLPLAEFVEAIHRAEAVGPILDPTLYMKAGSNLQEIKTQATALLSAQNFLLKHSEKFRQRVQGVVK